ncbi:hypothetical protein [Streptomyces sp. RerS4]|uniref:hypothetical protein n=1 Tax=Streptomyces sp. RerS4 TaxID=2942449 RepID=UPI00201C53BF|nr:hypothetical protein [Streptomyces sp. RerS4]UQX02218.1 hypothetical protein M4D82_18295 [Streptomyces sp. RerS4]
MEHEQRPDPARPSRRGRTTLLIAGALVLGALAGTVTGYAVQYHREPTPLPPLAQQKLVTPKPLAPDDGTTNKSINANRHHKTDDDLADLLVTAPDGAKVEGSGYEFLGFFAAHFFEDPQYAFPDLARNRIRRVASTEWTQGDGGRVLVQVRLLQFNDRSGAEEYLLGQAQYMPEKKYAGNSGVAIPGLPGDLGHVWVDSQAREKPGYHPVRGARALARRGDIVLDIGYYDRRGKIAESDVMDLTKRQLERL